MAALATLIAWREVLEAGRTAEKRVGLEAARRATSASTLRIEERLRTLEKERADLQSTLESLQTADAGTTKAAAKKATTQDAVTAAVELMKADEQRQKDPQVQLRQLAAERIKLAARFGPFYWKLGLPPEQIEKFETISARHEEQRRDLYEAVVAQGASVGEPLFNQLYSPLALKMDQGYRSAVKDLLGEAGYRQFADYERELPARKIVSDVAGAAAVAGWPLSPEYAERLVGLVASTSNNYRKGGEVSGFEIDWTRVDAGAAAFLSSEQMAVFKNVEPAGGAGGRFWLHLSSLIDDARKADRKVAADGLKSVGG